jgi:tRNA dimethylallyltransferase
MRKTKQNILVICGPTASGKTGLALQLGKELPKANILSVDSRQVYKELDIITGKDIPKNLPKKISIFGHNLFNPDERANLADFVRYSQKIILDSKKSDTPLIIVGGTGLYLKAITQNLSNVEIPPNPKLRQKLEKLSLEKLQDKLKKENPNKFSSLNRSDFMNPRRLIRALEISASPLQPKVQSHPAVSTTWIGLMPDKITLKENIRNRVLVRLKLGAIEEVKHLIKNFPNRKLTIYSSLGVSQIIDFLDKKIMKEELIETWTNAEADYARRQIVWFKKQPGIVWYDKDIDKLKLSKDLSKIYQ